MRTELVVLLFALAIIGIGWLLYLNKKALSDHERSEPLAKDDSLINSNNFVHATPTTPRSSVESTASRQLAIASDETPAIATPTPPDNQLDIAEKKLAYAFVDLETTGLDCEKDRIIEICVFIVTLGESSHDGISTLVNPGRPLSTFITELTGITDEMLLKEPGEECLHKYFDLIGDSVVFAYNAEFDMSFLRAAARRLDRSFENSSSCILERVKAEYPGLRSYKLNDVCEAFGVKVDGAAHRAGDDAERVLYLWDAVNKGRKPDPTAFRLNVASPDFGVYGHYRRDAVLFYVWTARNGESTTPGQDALWTQYVDRTLQGEYEVRCLRGGVTFSEAISLKEQYLAEHAQTVLNRVNIHRRILPKELNRFQSLKSSSLAHRDKGKWLEKSDPHAAVEHYRVALQEVYEYSEIVYEDGLFGQVVQDMNRLTYGGDAIRVLDRITLLLCKEGDHVAANAIAQEVFGKFPAMTGSKGAAAIVKRIAKRASGNAVPE